MLVELREPAGEQLAKTKAIPRVIALFFAPFPII